MGSTRNFNLLIPRRQRIVLPTDENKNNNIQASIQILFVARIGIYAAILGTLIIVFFLIFKYLGSCNDSGRVASETEPLVQQKIIGLPYGTDEGDEGYNTAGSSSSDDLYDGKICVICYDILRNCFFVPCGHCATCHDCAMRIMEGENKVCPICRRFIHKVKRLLMP